MSEAHTIDGRTKRALDTAIAKQQVSRESYRAVLEGRLRLAEAKELGRDHGPDGPTKPTTRISKDDRTRECIACGGLTKGGRFHPGCDAKMHRLAREYIRGERELTDEQLAYVRDETDKLERAHRRVAEEDAKRREREAKQARKSPATK